MEPTLVSTISSLFSGRVYPDIAPPDVAHPFCTFQQVGGQSITSFCGGGGTKGNARIQFNVWATSRDEANTKMRALAAELTDGSIGAIAVGELMARYEPVTRTYGAQQDFSIWSTEF